MGHLLTPTLFAWVGLGGSGREATTPELSAHIAATGMPFPAKKLVGLLSPVWCSRLSCGHSAGRGEGL